jgi:hypothetical protein
MFKTFENQYFQETLRTRLELLKEHKQNFLILIFQAQVCFSFEKKRSGRAVVIPIVPMISSKLSLDPSQVICTRFEIVLGGPHKFERGFSSKGGSTTPVTTSHHQSPPVTTKF